MDDVISMKLLEWEQEEDPKAPLSAKQRDFLMELATYAYKRPLPISMQDKHRRTSESESETTKMTSNEQFLPSHLESFIESDSKIHSAYDFYDWFSIVEDEMVTEEDSKYRNILEELRRYGEQSGTLLKEVESSLDHLKSLNDQYRLVSTKTNSLHEACEQLLAEQTRLVNAAENISEKLSYFNEFDKISQKLSSPTLSVINESFIPMLSRLDECIAFLTTNILHTTSRTVESIQTIYQSYNNIFRTLKSQYKESGSYLIKFHHCLSRALNMIHAYVVKSLQKATQQVTPSKEMGSSFENAFTLFYGKFRTNATRIKSLMEQIEMRVHHGPEYQQLLSDCHQCYFSQREVLIIPSLTDAIGELVTNHQRDHCSLVRSGCSLLLHLCEDEHQLFLQFFSNCSDQLDQFLDELCQKLYDVLRPLVIHINHLETLAELCSILKVEMLEERVSNNTIRLVAFESFVTQMLQDVQERLVYRSYVYIQTDILNYHPAPGDLAYPEKLQMMANIAESLTQVRLSRTESLSSLASSSSVTSQEVAAINASSEQQKMSARITGQSPADLHGMWYPTVRRTLGCLSKLYRCIDRAIFQGLSQEALAMCIQSLITAGDLIAKKQTPLDGQLFQIKHLLILREQISPFQVDFSVKETALDFSKVKSAAVNLLHKRNWLFTFGSNNALLEFVVQGTPQVTEHFLDSKKDVDTHLKLICDDLINFCTTLLTGPLKMFIDKANVILKVNAEDSNRSVTLRNQPFASAEKVSQIVTEANRQVKLNFPKLQSSMSLYLANRETEAILFRPIKINVVLLYQCLSDVIVGNYLEEDQLIIGCPSADHIAVMLT